MKLKDFLTTFNVNIDSNQRFTLKCGKYGLYIYDSLKNKDLSLDEVIETLNKYA